MPQSFLQTHPHIRRIIYGVCGLGVLALAGCTSAGDFVGVVHGYIGEIDTPIGLTIDGIPTILPDVTSQLGYERAIDGRVRDAFSTLKTRELSATGLTANILACEADPDCLKAALSD